MPLNWDTAVLNTMLYYVLKFISLGFEEYLLRGKQSDFLKIVELFIKKIREIRDWFERQDCLHFFASSLLLVYEGDRPLETNKSLKVDVKMIDFSHVFNVNSSKDENYIHGLNYILNTFNGILMRNA